MGNLYFQQYQMPKKCREETNFLFVSYSCEQSEQTLSDTYDRVSLAVGTGSLVCLLFFISIRFKREQGKIIQIEWDLATCTAGDYTVEMSINKLQYDDWYKDIYKTGQDSNKPPALALKRYLVNEIEREITKDLKRRKERGEGQSDDPDVIIVSDIVFAYNNHKLIEELRKRGGQIAANNFDGMRETEGAINKLISQSFEDLTRPTAAFITFENDLGKMLAVEADDVDKERKLLGRVMKFKNASEPTDIIWENRHFVKSETRSREFIAFLIIGFLLFLSFLFIFKVSRLSSSIAKTFPAVSCEAINNNYGTQL